MNQPIEPKALLRFLPKTEKVMDSRIFTQMRSSLGEVRFKQCVVDALDGVRQELLSGTVDADLLSCDNPAVALESIVMRRTESYCNSASIRSLRRVINATGVVIHTNLGRSPLAQAAVKAVAEVASGYSTLEYNVEKRVRGSRHDHVEQLLCDLTGAEAAMCVNNNAAAVFIILSEFAFGHEAIVSHGQLVEIGGSFRIPDIMDTAGAKMIAVGTTNKTRTSDYERAINDDTAMILKVHPSNYRVTGFTETPKTEDLAALAHRLRILFYEDLGSGMLFEMPQAGSYAEPTVSSCVAKGVDLVSCSGDKMFGGPQAGIIVGRRDYIDRLKKNPLARVLRLDKMTLAALEVTLTISLDESRALSEIPTLHMLYATPESLEPQAQRLASMMGDLVELGHEVSVVDATSRVGGGALAEFELPTRAVRVHLLGGNAEEVSQILATRDIPIICRIKEDDLLFDVRTLLNESDMSEICCGLKQAVKHEVR